MSASPDAVRRLTIADIGRMYADGERLPMLTAYDYPTARILDEAGIPMLLVGDSLGQVLLGYDSTVRVTMTEMLHHTAAVVRGTKRALVIGDMPFLSYSTPDEAIENAGRFLREAGATAVKIEGGVRSARIVEALSRAGIPVMGHIGWTPQSQHGMGGKVRVQGKSRETARALLSDAVAIQEAGAFAIVLELVPEQLASLITSRLRIPTIGIGAGAGCSGQVQVVTDLLGLGDLHAAPREEVRRPRRIDPGRGRGLCGRRRDGGLPGPGRDGPDGRRDPRRGPRPDGRRPRRRAGRTGMADGLPAGIPLDRDL